PNQPFVKSALDDTFFDLFDCDCRLVNPQYARRLAWGGTDASSEFRKVVGRMKLAHGFFPAAAVYQIIPVRNQIIDRTPGVAEWHAAIHTTRALCAQLLFGKVLVNLKPIIHPLWNGATHGAFAVML